jgi:hypothetical protein
MTDPARITPDQLAAADRAGVHPSPETDERDIIATARELEGPGYDVSDVKDAVLVLWGHGVADESTGSVDAPTGHLIRVGRFVVVTDGQGFTELATFSDIPSAVAAMVEADDAYGAWLGEDDEYGDDS